jgi:hypothetical protein
MQLQRPEPADGTEASRKRERIAHPCRAATVAHQRGEFARGAVAPAGLQSTRCPCSPSLGMQRTRRSRRRSRLADKQSHRLVHLERVPLGAPGRVEQDRHAGEGIRVEHVNERLSLQLVVMIWVMKIGPARLDAAKPVSGLLAMSCARSRNSITCTSAVSPSSASRGRLPARGDRPVGEGTTTG